MAVIGSLPVLYKRTSTGAIERWRVWVEQNALTDHEANPHDIVTEFGHVNGKLQLAVETVHEGKNLGKRNATTVREQALAQAKSEWEMKRSRKGYVESLEAAQAGQNAGAGGIRPMLAHKYSERGLKYAKFPGFVQAKFDGIRIVAVVKDGYASLWSREQKPIIGLPHIVKYLENRFAGESVILDSEAYHHDYRAKFEEITSFVKQKKSPKDGHEIVQLHVYDLPSHRGSWSERLTALRALKLDGPLVTVPTHAVQDEGELMMWFQAFLDDGYEGAMFRNSDGEYAEGRRSSDLLKVKVMEDAEYPIVGVEEGVGKMADLAIFICQAGDKPFRVKMKGKLEDLSKYLKDHTLWRGKQLTVQYQNLTADGLPRFPVGLRILGD